MVFTTNLKQWPTLYVVLFSFLLIILQGATTSCNMPFQVIVLSLVCTASLLARKAAAKLISHKSCGEPSLLVQCTRYKFGPGVIHTIEIAHRSTLLDGLWQRAAPSTSTWQIIIALERKCGGRLTKQRSLVPQGKIILQAFHVQR